MIKRNNDLTAIMLCLLLVIIQQSIQAVPRPSFSWHSFPMPTFAASKKMATKLGKITAALVAIGILGDQTFQRTETFKTKAKELIDSDNEQAFDNWVINHFKNLTRNEKMDAFAAKDKKDGTFFNPKTIIQILEVIQPGSPPQFFVSASNHRNNYPRPAFILKREDYIHDILSVTIVQQASFYKDLVNHADDYIVILNNNENDSDHLRQFVNPQTKRGFNNDGKKAHIIAQDMKKYATDNPSIDDYVPLFIQKNRKYNSIWFRWRVLKSLFAGSDQPPAKPDEPPVKPDEGLPKSTSSTTTRKKCPQCNLIYTGETCLDCVTPPQKPVRK